MAFSPLITAQIVVLSLASGISPACTERRFARYGSDVWCLCNAKKRRISTRAICESAQGGRAAACAWSTEFAACSPKAGDTLAAECVGRSAARRGSDFWCRCGRDGKKIETQTTCERGAQGRIKMCHWSDSSQSCVSNAMSEVSPTLWPQKSPVGCPDPRGDATFWSRKSSGSGHFTVATWNVEWLFDGKNDDNVPSKRGMPLPVRTSAVEEVLQRIDADIVHFAEVENCLVLSRIAEGLNASYEAYLVRGTDSSTRQQVGLLSRLRPLTRVSRSSTLAPYPRPESKCGAFKNADRTTGVSKHLVARFALAPGHELVMIGAHLKAHPSMPAACHQREGQAEVLRGLVLAALREGSHVIVLGDLNDFDADVPGTSGSVPTSSVLRTLKDPDSNGVADLWNALAAVPLSRRYTSWYDVDKDGVLGGRRERSALDHVLVSESLRPLVEAVGIDHAHDPGQLSDHWPVWVRFDLTSLLHGPRADL